MIDTQAIRSKILDLAMRGQLTEQLPEDGTAEELYQQIQAEKQALIKAGKIKKEKPLPDISEDEILFKIPDNWKWVRLNSVCYRIFAGGDKPGDFVKEKDNLHMVPVVANGVANEGIMGYTATATASSNTITVAGRGTIGFPCYRNYEYCPVVRLIVIEQSDYIDPMYLYFIFLGLPADSVGSSIPQLTVPMVLPKLIPLPPLVEQQRIVEKIEQAFSVLDTIDLLQAQYADNLTVLKSKLIDLAIQGKLTEQLPEDGTAEELYQQIQAEKQALIKAGKIKKEKPLPTTCEEPYEIPSSWKWVGLGSVSRILGGKRIPAGRSLTKEDTGHKYIRVSEMKNRTVITDGLMYVPEDIYPSISQYIIKKEDVYITVAGTIGKVGKIPPEIDGANLTENADRIVFTHLNQDWLIICLSSSVVQKQIELLTTQVAQPKLAIKRIQEFLIPLPPLAEQKRIVAKLDEVLKIIE